MALLRKTADAPTWNPWRELEVMSNRIDRLFGQISTGNGQEALATTTGWSPKVNVSENDGEYLVIAEIPGVDKKDVHVKMDENILTIEGERKQRKEEKSEKLHRVESFYGNFYRRFNMPENADPEKVNAKYDNGMLEIHIAKRPEAKKAKAKEIAIE